MRRPALVVVAVVAALTALVAGLLLVGGGWKAQVGVKSGVARSFATAPSASGGSVSPTKVLAFVEENHSYQQMHDQMPYLFELAQHYGYATDWSAISHPSLPNYLAITGGSTFGVADDNSPVAHPISGPSVFDQAINAGKTAKTYAETMPSNCALEPSGQYAVKHNPWAYFVDSRNRCNREDVPLTQLASDASNGTLPNVGMVIPNLCDDGHSCSLPVADGWLRAQLPNILDGPDFTSGRLTVVVTADEDDKASGNKVLTVVMHAGMTPTVVSTPLTHYSLTRYYAQVLGVTPLGVGASAPDMKVAFGL